MSIRKYRTEPDNVAIYDGRMGLSPHLACPNCFGEELMMGQCIKCRIEAREFYDSPKE